jgi:hypothetical protein
VERTAAGDGSRRRRMIRGTIARIGELGMRYGRPSQLATLDCTSSRRSTVMRALPRAIAVITEYQRDSSSKRPRLSVVSAARSPTNSLRKLPQLWTLENAPTAAWKTQDVFHSYRRPLSRVLTAGHSISA